MKTRDSLDRAFPNQPDELDQPYTIQDADIFGTAEPLNIHGSMFNPYLEAFADFYRDTGDYSRKRISWLSRSKNIRYLDDVGGPLFYRPPDQFPEDASRFSRKMTLRYDLTPRGIAILKSAGRYHDITHEGWRKHQVANTHISASIHLGALHDNVPFVPRDRIAKDIGVTVPYRLRNRDYEKHRLVPDNLFHALRYLTLETDLGNEVGRADSKKVDTRKTLERMVLQIAHLIGGGLYHKAYGIPDDKGMLALFVTTQESKIALVSDIIDEHIGPCNYILMQHVPAHSFSAYHSPKPLNLWSTRWKRVGRPDFYINDPARQ